MIQDKPIIESLLDTDRYKFSMQKAFLDISPSATAKYRFKCRTTGVNIGKYADEIREEVQNLASLSFSPNELDFLQSIPSLSGNYIDFLRDFRLDTAFVHIEADGQNLIMEAQGLLVHVMPLEIYLLAIVQEVFTRNEYPREDYRNARCRLEEKILFLKNNPAATGFHYADFGGRRRESRSWHDYTVQHQAEVLPENFIGTSNMYLAMKYGLPPIGTMAHEYLQAFQAFSPRLGESQKRAVTAWLGEFGGDLGIVLTDVVGMDAFLRDLDQDLAQQLSGFRHDSGCPYRWTEKLVKRLKELHVDPRAKTAVYSDGLTIKNAVALFSVVKESIQPFFGIGTHLTNDFGRHPLSLVMKMVECNGKPVAKISDSSGKEMCEDKYFMRQLMQEFKIVVERV